MQVNECSHIKSDKVDPQVFIAQLVRRSKLLNEGFQVVVSLPKAPSRP
jgi:hypothetical protein